MTIPMSYHLVGKNIVALILIKMNLMQDFCYTALMSYIQRIQESTEVGTLPSFGGDVLLSLERRSNSSRRVTSVTVKKHNHNDRMYGYFKNVTQFILRICSIFKPVCHKKAQKQAVCQRKSENVISFADYNASITSGSSCNRNTNTF